MFTASQPRVAKLLRNHATFSAMSGVPRIAPLMLHELTQRYNGYK